MIGWMKERLDKAVAATIVLGCVSILVWRLVPGKEQSADAAAVSAAVDAAQGAVEGGGAEEVVLPDYHGAFAANMTRSEKPLPPDVVAWIFSPQPPAIVGPPPPPPNETVATQKLPTIAIEADSVTIGRCALKVAFGEEGGIWRARALQVWRKAADEADWPEEPFLTIKATAEGATVLPAGAAAKGDGYEVVIDDQRPRTLWEYRVRAAAVFPKTVKALREGRLEDFAVKLSEDPVEREDLLEDEAAALTLRALLLGDPPVFTPLGGGPFFTRYSKPVAVALPGDTQISYEAPVAIDGRDSANFRIRHYRPGVSGADRDGWCVRLERFNPGDDVRIAGWRMISKDPAGGGVRRETVEVDSGFRLTRLFERPGPGLSALRVAVVKELATGLETELVARADGGGWWPNDLPIGPKDGEAAGPTAPPAPAPR